LAIFLRKIQDEAAVVWGSFNIAVGYVLIVRVGAFDLHDTSDALAAGLGTLFTAIITSRLFGELYGGNSPG
jgi:hypothetical protein